MYTVGQFTESVFRNTHTVQSVFSKDFLQFFSCFSIKFGICILYGIVGKRQRYHIKSRIKRRVDQIGMHGNLYRVSIHQRLNSFRLISIGQLIGCVNIDSDLASGSLFHQLAEFFTGFCPGTGFCCGTSKVPGHLRPVQITVICNIIKILLLASACRITGFCLFFLDSSVSTILGQCLGKCYGNLRNIGNYKKNSHTCSNHRKNGFGNLLQGNFQTFFNFDANCHKQIDTNRRSHLSDGKVYRCHNTECHHIIAKGFAYRKHDRDKNIHG